jgi:hypothetical protein
VFAALRPTGDLTVVFGSVLTAMSVVAVLAVLVSLRTGPDRSGRRSPRRSRRNP